MGSGMSLVEALGSVQVLGTGLFQPITSYLPERASINFRLWIFFARLRAQEEGGGREIESGPGSSESRGGEFTGEEC